MEERIMKMLHDRFMIEFGNGVDQDSDLFQLGLLDSQAYIELIQLVETEFNLRLSNEQILSSVFVSVSGIASLVSCYSETSV